MLVDTRHLTTADGVRLVTRRWSPVGEPRAAVALLHGFAEHSGRYEHVASTFASDHGLETFAVDLRGHGDSQGARGRIGLFADYRQDVDALLDWIAAERPGRPVAMLAHSMGGLVAADWLLTRGPGPVERCAMSSPYLGLVRRPPWLLRTAVSGLSRLAPDLRLGVPLRGDELCTDPELAAAHDADEKIFYRARLRWIAESLAAHRRVLEHASDITVPLLVMYAIDDCIADPESAREFAARAPRAEAVAVGQKHEILNSVEPARRAIIDRFAAFLGAGAA